MENLLRPLPNRPQSILVRYGVTTLIVLVCFPMQIAVEFQSEMFTFFLLLPGIFLASVLFDRGSGFYATILSTALCIVVLLPPQLVAAASVSFASSSVRVCWACPRNGKRGYAEGLEKAVAAEQSKEVIIQELNHRIRNNLAMLASILELQLRSQTEPGAKDAFASAAARVHVIANAHDHLLPRHGQSTIDMREYLTACCRNLGDTLRDVRPIAVNVRVSQIYLRSEKAVAVGLIVNELVTNALKYAFPDERGGVVNVTLHGKTASELELVVEDNGKGCPEDAKEGLGSRIVRLLAQQLGTTIRREGANPGCRVSLTISERLVNA